MTARGKTAVVITVTFVVVTGLSVALGFLWDAMFQSEDLTTVFRIISGGLIGWVGAGVGIEWHQNWTRR